MRIVLLCIFLLGGCVAEPRPAVMERMVALASIHHPIAPDDLSRLSDEELAALRSLARDEGRPLWLRLRALGLASARPSSETRELWLALRAAPERELRWQATWAEGLSLDAGARVSFAVSLLERDDEELREAGAHLLGTVPEARARGVALRRLELEESERVRAVLERKVLRE